MSAIYLPRRWRHQPQGAVRIDPNHPIGAKVHYAYTPWLGLTSITPGQRSVTATPAPGLTSTATTQGTGAKILRTGNFTGIGVNTDDTVALATASKGGAVFFLVEKIAYGRTTEVGLLRLAGGGGLRISADPTRVLQFYAYSATRLVGVETIPSGYTGSIGASAEDRSLVSTYVGDKIGIDRQSTGGFNLDAVTGIRSLTVDYPTWGCPLFIRAEYLTHDEMRALNAEPWAIFKPKQDRIWFDVGAGGSPGIYTLDAQPISIGASPQAGSPLAKRALDAQAVSVAVTGADAGLNKLGSYGVEAQPITLSLTAQAAGLAVIRRLSADPVTVTLTAAPATGYARRLLAADAVAVSISGMEAGLHRSGYYPLEADPASVSILFADAGLVVNRLGQSVRSTGGGGSGGGHLWHKVGEEIEEEMHALLRDPEPVVAHPVDASPLKAAVVAALPEERGAEEAFAEALREYQLAQAALLQRRRERRKRILLLS